ncbi:MAG: hypothetical protein ACOY5R_20755 [Pseudomonadota bacterium]|uniref:hypothetical protein n=1 Tax=Rhizorhabdus phycosphaerae TaxID=2711156 RepID=UPI0013EB4113|nr:hypothetical protein [Rhizorhabdus phycosphaerae]
MNSGASEACWTGRFREIWGEGYDPVDFDPLDPADATARFGQDDHVRRFGGRDVQQTLGMIFRLPERYELTDSFDEPTLISNSIPRVVWQGWCPSSVLVLDKADLLLRGA